jgi:hypothetical protein
MFLLDAPLDLAGGDLTDVLLEAQAGGGRRIDVEAGSAAIEVKKSLASPKVLASARDQLAGYVRQRTDETSGRYVGILTDGQVWILYRLTPSDELVEAARFDLTAGSEADELAAWLEAVLATGQRLAPTPREILRQLGAESPGFMLDLADLRALYEASADHPEVQLKRELWARLLVAALGTNFDATDELFVMHTYLVLTAELIAHEVVGIHVAVPGMDVRALIEGEQFRLAGLHGVVEADFFDWPILATGGTLVVRGIARRLARFAWDHVEHDVLKVLYESVIDSRTRQQLGEYYTPDWLAERMINQTFTDAATQTLLDPACGSGTFLFWAVRKALGAYDAEGLTNQEALAQLVTRVHGVDLHPVAVTLARVTYLLAIGRERLADRGELTIPVYLGDSVRWEQDNTLLAQGGLSIHTSDGMELFAQELHFPEGVLADPERFDRLVVALADRAAKRERPSSLTSKPQIPSIAAILKSHDVSPSDHEALTLVFEKLCRLHDAGRDHVWGYYVRNLARPLAFMRADGQVDVLVGNPPWLAYRNMPDQIQASYRLLAKARGLWAGGKVATNQDLSDLFVARAVEQYLKPGGHFSFVMPFAVLSRRQFAGFRTGDWTSQGGGITAVRFEEPEEFARVKPAMFPVPSCVVSGVKQGPPSPLPLHVTRWTGRVPAHHISWADAEVSLAPTVATIATAADSDEGSPYRERFRQGATLVPSLLVRVESIPAGPLGLAAGQSAVRSARSALEKRPWKDLPSLTGVVETRFLHPMHMGSTIVAFRSRQPTTVLVPWADGKLMHASSEELEQYSGLAAWWREAERVWNANRAPSNKMTLIERLDFQRLLSLQFPVAQHRVVYSASGQYLAACRLEDPHAVVEHKLYWAAVPTRDEARYLTGILNSRAITEAVLPLQSRGQHNPRDFDTHVFATGFPAFDSADPRHAAIAKLAARAETVAAETELDDGWQFQRARRTIRESLASDSVAEDLDEAVDDLMR